MMETLKPLPNNLKYSDFIFWICECNTRRHDWGDYDHDLTDTNETRDDYIKAVSNAIKYRKRNDVFAREWLRKFAPHLLTK